MHNVGNAVYQVYQRHDRLEKRRTIMRDWNEAVFKRSKGGGLKSAYPCFKYTMGYSTRGVPP